MLKTPALFLAAKHLKNHSKLNGTLNSYQLENTKLLVFCSDEFKGHWYFYHPAVTHHTCITVQPEELVTSCFGSKCASEAWARFFFNLEMCSTFLNFFANFERCASGFGFMSDFYFPTHKLCIQYIRKNVIRLFLTKKFPPSCHISFLRTDGMPINSRTTLPSKCFLLKNVLFFQRTWFHKQSHRPPSNNNRSLIHSFWNCWCSNFCVLTKSNESLCLCWLTIE